MSGTVRFITNKPDLTEVTRSRSAARCQREGRQRAVSGRERWRTSRSSRTSSARAPWCGVTPAAAAIDQPAAAFTHEDVNDQTVWGGRLSLASQVTDQLQDHADGSVPGEPRPTARGISSSATAGPYQNISPTHRAVRGRDQAVRPHRRPWEKAGADVMIGDGTPNRRSSSTLLASAGGRCFLDHSLATTAVDFALLTPGISTAPAVVFCGHGVNTHGVVKIVR